MTSMEPTTSPFERVTALPYAWPFDGRWSPADTALLVIDSQRWMTDALCAAAGSARGPTDSRSAHDAASPAGSMLSRLIPAARQSRLRLVFTQRVRDAAPESLVTRRATANHAAGAIDALPPAAHDAAAAFAWPQWMRPEDLSVARSAWSAFNGSTLLDQLTTAGVRNLVFAGFTTDGAVHATMRKANDAGFECLLLEDACIGSSADHHQTILDVTRFGNGLFGATARTCDFICALTT